MNKCDEQSVESPIISEVLTPEQRIAIDILDDLCASMDTIDQFEAMAYEIAGYSSLPSLRDLYYEAQKRAKNVTQYGKICLYLSTERERRRVTWTERYSDDISLEEMKRLNHEVKKRREAFNKLMEKVNKQR